MLALLFGTTSKRHVSLWIFDSSNTIVIAEQTKGLGFITTLSWSKLSNMMAIGLSTGQCWLYDGDCGSRSHMEVNSLMHPVLELFWCDVIDMLAMAGKSNEISLTTMENIGSYYHSVDLGNFRSIKFSSTPHQATSVAGENPDSMVNLLRTESYIWMSFVDKSHVLIFKPIQIVDSIYEQDTLKLCKSVRIDSNDADIISMPIVISHIIDYYWLDGRHVIIAHKTGYIVIATIEKFNSRVEPTQLFYINGDELVELDVFIGNREDSADNELRSLQLYKFPPGFNRQKNPMFTLAIGQAHSVMILDVYSAPSSDHDNNLQDSYVLERVDYLDLKNILRKLSAEIKSLSWSPDGRLLTVQLTDNSVIIERVRLASIMSHSCGTRLAYLSDDKEVTIIKHQQENKTKTNLPNSEQTKQEDYTLVNIITLDVHFSYLAVGPLHLAVVFNNRIWYYMTSQSNANVALINQRDYISIVSSIQLNSNMAAVLFSDGRLQLHSVQTLKGVSDKSTSQLDTNADNRERFFPDPSSARQEKIVCFSLTEMSLIYATDMGRLVTFSLKRWKTIRTYVHSDTSNNLRSTTTTTTDASKKFTRIAKNISSMNQQHRNTTSVHFTKIVPNSNGTILILIDNTNQAFVHHPLCDTMINFNTHNTDFFNKVVENSDSLHSSQVSSIGMFERMDILWEHNKESESNYGKTFIAVDESKIHVFVYWFDTLISPMVCHVSSIVKAISHNVLIFSKGTVGCQTNIGKLFNMILDCHDDDKMLATLERNLSDLVVNTRQAPHTDDAINDESHHDLEDKFNISQIELKMRFIKIVAKLKRQTNLYDICEYLTTDKSFNLQLNEPQQIEGDSLLDNQSEQLTTPNDALWEYLGRFTLFMMDLRSATRIYRKLNRFDIVECLQQMRKPNLMSGSDDKNVVCAYIAMILNLKELAQEKLLMCPKKIRAQIVELSIDSGEWDEALHYAKLFDKNKLPLIYYKKAMDLEVDEESYKLAYEDYSRAYSILKILNYTYFDLRFFNLSYRSLAGMARCTVQLKEYDKAYQLVQDKMVPFYLKECSKEDTLTLKEYIEDVAELLRKSEQLDRAARLCLAIKDYDLAVKYKLLTREMDDVNEEIIGQLSDQAILLDCSKHFLFETPPTRSISILERILQLQQVHGAQLNKVNVALELVSLVLIRLNDPTYAMKLAKKYENQEAVEKVLNFVKQPR